MHIFCMSNGIFLSAASPAPGREIWELALHWVKDRAALYYVRMHLFEALEKSPVSAIWHVTQPLCTLQV